LAHPTRWMDGWMDEWMDDMWTENTFFILLVSCS
jgi:hypothetical protein